MGQIHTQPGALCCLYLVGLLKSSYFQTLQGHNGPPRSQMGASVELGVLGNILQIWKKFPVLHGLE